MGARDEQCLPSENRLLASLPLDELQRLRPLMYPVQLRYKQAIHRSGEAIRSVYFPTTAVFSLISNLRNGTSTELAMIGFEGVVGVSAVFGSGSMPFDVTVQVAGTAFQMSARVLAQELHGRALLRARLLLYTQAFIDLIGQGSACGRHHEVRQRTARWLLMIRDRVGSDRVPVTHEFLGQILGVGRPSVTLTIDALQAAGLVRVGRGSVTIRDRPGLEATACECYDSMRDEYSRLLG